MDHLWSPTIRCLSFYFIKRQTELSKKSAWRSQVAVDEDGQTYAGMGVDFADYNNDGLPDLIVDRPRQPTYALYTNRATARFNYDELCDRDRRP